MTQTFNQPWPKRGVIIVDDDGIHLRKENSLAGFIRWDELKQLGSQAAYSENGSKISIALGKTQSRKFFNFASEVWKQHYPDRWQRNHDRIIRKANWIVYFWYPLFFISPFLIFQTIFWLRGSPDSLRPSLQKIHRLTVVGIVWSAFFIGLFSYLKWKAARRRRESKKELEF